MALLVACVLGTTITCLSERAYVFSNIESVQDGIAEEAGELHEAAFRAIVDILV